MSTASGGPGSSGEPGSSGGRGSGEHFLDEVEKLLGAFGNWSASERTGQAARSRSRTRSLAAQAASTSTWEGMLVELAERGGPVTVSVGGGHLSGQLVGVGRDFCVLEQAGGWPVLVASARIDAASPAQGAAGGPGLVPAGDRHPPVELTMSSALAGLADERAPVTVRSGAATVEGDLVAVGEDVLTISTGPARQMTHVPLGSVSWCRLR